MQRDPLLEKKLMKNDSKVSLPTIKPDLLEALDKLFPNKSPELNWSEKECWWTGGQRSVVNFLRQQYEIQNENILEN